MATHHCAECAEFLCAECYTTHGRGKKTRAHAVQTVADLAAGGGPPASVLPPEELQCVEEPCEPCEA